MQSSITSLSWDDAPDILRHADVSTTLNTYGHVLDEMKAASAEKLNGIIGNVLPVTNSVSTPSVPDNN